MVSAIYTTSQEQDSYLNCAAPASFLLGAILSGFSRYIGRQKLQLIVASLIAAPLLGAIASATVDSKSMVIGLLIVGSVSIGYVEGVSVTSSGISTKNQEEIGVAVGVSSTIRTGWSTVASTIYLTVLQNRLQDTVPQQVRLAAHTSHNP